VDLASVDVPTEMSHFLELENVTWSSVTPAFESSQMNP